MLRKSVNHQTHKSVPVPPLYKGEQEVVQIEIKDVNGKVVEKRTEYVPKSRPIEKGELIKHEPADLYDITNLMAAGIKPTVCPSGSYISRGIDALPDVENASAELLYQSEQKAAQKASQKAEKAPESNTENTNE